MELGQLRQYFKDERLHFDELLENPYDQFEIWFNDACRAQIPIPNMMTLSTLDENGIPSSRMVLLRKMERDGFSFFTRYDSQKAVQIEQNPKASLHFSWQIIDRQVSISGRLEKTSVSESRKFFNSCNRDVRLAARTPRLEEIGSYEALQEKLKELDIQYEGTQIPMPDWWGGYRIVPSRFEFWQGRSDYLHDRYEYTPNHEGTWIRKRISP